MASDSYLFFNFACATTRACQSSKLPVQHTGFVKGEDMDDMDWYKSLFPRFSFGGLATGCQDPQCLHGSALRFCFSDIGPLAASGWSDLTFASPMSFASFGISDAERVRSCSGSCSRRNPSRLAFPPAWGMLSAQSYLRSWGTAQFCLSQVLHVPASGGEKEQGGCVGSAGLATCGVC